VVGADAGGAEVAGAVVSGAAAEPQATAKSRGSNININGVNEIILDFLRQLFTMIEPPYRLRFRCDTLIPVFQTLIGKHCGDMRIVVVNIGISWRWRVSGPIATPPII
jgi:hypothetical protein